MTLIVLMFFSWICVSLTCGNHAPLLLLLFQKNESIKMKTKIFIQLNILLYVYSFKMTVENWPNIDAARCRFWYSVECEFIYIEPSLFHHTSQHWQGFFTRSQKSCLFPVLEWTIVVLLFSSCFEFVSTQKQSSFEGMKFFGMFWLEFRGLALSQNACSPGWNYGAIQKIWVVSGPW